MGKTRRLLSKNRHVFPLNRRLFRKQVSVCIKTQFVHNHTLTLCLIPNETKTKASRH